MASCGQEARPTLTRSPGENGAPGDRRAQALGHRKGVMGGEAGQQHGELLAADAEDGVLVADGAAQGLGDLAQRLVADRMAVRVVDALEVVDVDRREREGGVGPSARARSSSASWKAR